MLYHLDTPSVTLRSWSWTLKFYVYVFWLNFSEVYIFGSFSWILLILCLILDTGLNVYDAPSPPPYYPWGQGHRLWTFKLKCLIKVFRSEYLLNFSLDLVDTLPDIRYWSELLCCTIPMSPPPHWPWGQGHRHRIVFVHLNVIWHQSVIRSIHISNRVCFHSITTDLRVHSIGWGSVLRHFLLSHLL